MEPFILKKLLKFIVLFWISFGVECITVSHVSGNTNSVTTPAKEWNQEIFKSSTILGDVNDGYAFASRTENGVTFEYTYHNGNEILKVSGQLPPHFDKTAILEQFRMSIQIHNQQVKMDEFDASEEEDLDLPATEEKSKSLLESFTEFIIGSKKTTIQLFKDEQLQMQAQMAKEEYQIVMEDLKKLSVQENILRTRQNELAEYLEQNMKKPLAERNPTVEELVSLEDDRLALLENRLLRLKRKLLRQRSELSKFLAINDRSHYTVISENNPSETHIFHNSLEQSKERKNVV